jgi:hypothetical protein
MELGLKTELIPIIGKALLDSSGLPLMRKRLQVGTLLIIFGIDSLTGDWFYIDIFLDRASISLIHGCCCPWVC